MKQSLTNHNVETFAQDLAKATREDDTTKYDKVLAANHELFNGLGPEDLLDFRARFYHLAHDVTVVTKKNVFGLHFQ